MKCVRISLLLFHLCILQLCFSIQHAFYSMAYFDQCHIYKCEQAEAWKAVVFWDVPFLVVFRALRSLLCEKAQASLLESERLLWRRNKVIWPTACPQADTWVEPSWIIQPPSGLPADCRCFSEPSRNRPADLDKRSAQPIHNIMSYINVYCFKSLNCVSAYYTAKANQYSGKRDSDKVRIRS